MGSHETSPATSFIGRTKAVTSEFALLVLPANGSLKFAYGSLILVNPASTASPVATTLPNVL